MVDWLECPDCGEEVFESDPDGYFVDGTNTVCGCGAHIRVSCDSESDPYVLLVDP